MPRPKQKIEVDGLTYWVVKCGPFESMRLDALGSKLLGPLFRALSTSDSAVGVLGSLFKGGEAKVEDVLDSDPAGLMMALGMSIDDLVARVSGDDLIEAARLMAIGKLSCPYAGAPEVLIEDDGTYESIIGAAMDKHGHMHQLKLLWACLRVNLGPTIAGRSTDSPGS